MKFCKDCKHYSPSVVFASMYCAGAVPASCGREGVRDPVTGGPRITGLCDSLRIDESKCGPSGAWFEPATLDGRLAMLEGS